MKSDLTSAAGSADDLKQQQVTVLRLIETKDAEILTLTSTSEKLKFDNMHLNEQVRQSSSLVQQLQEQVRELKVASQSIKSESSETSSHLATKAEELADCLARNNELEKALRDLRGTISAVSLVEDSLCKEMHGFQSAIEEITTRTQSAAAGDNSTALSMSVSSPPRTFGSNTPGSSLDRSTVFNGNNQSGYLDATVYFTPSAGDKSMVRMPPSGNIATPHRLMSLLNISRANTPASVARPATSAAPTTDTADAGKVELTLTSLQTSWSNLQFACAQLAVNMQDLKDMHDQVLAEVKTLKSTISQQESQLDSYHLENSDLKRLGEQLRGEIQLFKERSTPLTSELNELKLANKDAVYRSKNVAKDIISSVSSAIRTVHSSSYSLHSELHLNIIDLENVEYSTPVDLVAAVSSFIQQTMRMISDKAQAQSEALAAKSNAYEELRQKLIYEERTARAKVEEYTQLMQSLEVKNNAQSRRIKDLETMLDSANDESQILKMDVELLAQEKEVLNDEVLALTTDKEVAIRQLEDAERELAESKDRLRGYLHDVESKTKTIHQLEEDLKTVKRRSSDLEARAMLLSDANNELRVEKGKSDHACQTLEGELRTTRMELQNLQQRSSQFKQVDSLNVEKLLVALSSAFDQIAPSISAVMSASASVTSSPSGGHAAGGGAGPLSDLPSNDLISVKKKLLADEKDDIPTGAAVFSPMSQQLNKSISQRVDIAIKQLNDLKTAIREDNRSKKILQQQIEQLKHELDLVRGKSGESIGQVERYQQLLQEKDQQLQSKEISLANTVSQLSLAKAETQRLRDDIVRMNNNLETEVHERIRQQGDIKVFESDVRRYCAEIDTQKNLVRSLTEELQRSKDQFRALTSESESNSNNAKLLKAQVVKLTSTIDSLNGQLAKATADKGEIERALRLEIAEFSARNSRQTAELEKTIKTQHDELIELRQVHSSTHHTSAAALAEQGQKVSSLMNELNGYKRKAQQLETKVTHVSDEKAKLAADLASMQQELFSVKKHMEVEHSQRLSLESSLEQIKKSASDEKRNFVQETTGIVAEFEKRLNKLEEEKKTMRATMKTLKAANDENERKWTYELEMKKKTDAEVLHLHSKYESVVREFKETEEKLIALRNEGIVIWH